MIAFDTVSAIKAGVSLVSAAFLVLSSRLFIHMLQQEGYKIKGLFCWLSKNTKKAYLITGISALVLIACQIALNIIFARDKTPYIIFQSVLSALFIAAFVFSFFKLKIANAKKPLNYTERVKRLFIALSFISLIICGALFFIDEFLLKNTYCYGIIIYLALVMQAGAVILSGFIMLPLENGIKKWYFNDAKKIISRKKDLIRIGITGSYGKTSTKFILGSILSQKYSALVTPSSFNTPMGITRIIREKLDDSNEVFIAEMGARHKGDIAELCSLVKPGYGILTSIGSQHLETFKTIETVKETKYELIEALPAAGVAFFNADDKTCLELYEKTAIEKRLFGIENKSKEVYVRAKNISTGPFGSRFTLIFSDGVRISTNTSLLGRHNILNIAGCAGLARVLGLSAEEIAKGIEELKPVEHRLNILPTNNGVTVIDDAFNSNPEGVKMAMEVLAGFKGRKIVVTPGMVELGQSEKEENYKFGQLMAKTADIVYLIGEKRSRPLYDGLKDSEFFMDNVYVFNTLDEATAKLGETLKFGDIVLFENDLPDNYSE